MGLSVLIKETWYKGMVVALARKLLIALWRFATQGVVPEGAVMKPAT
jgi:transposase